MLTEMLKRSEILAGMIDFMFPPLCIACGAFDEKAECICARCQSRIVRLGFPTCLNCDEAVQDKLECRSCAGDSFPLYALGEYAPPLDDAIIQFKFKGIASPAKLFAQMLTEEFEDQIHDHRPEFLVPIPLHPSREHIRGYNQAELFANELGLLLDIPVMSDLIFRSKKRKPQARLNLINRADNIRGVFKIEGTEDESCRIILVDDVVTSGATIKEARRMLSEAGHVITAAISIAHAT